MSKNLFEIDLRLLYEYDYNPDKLLDSKNNSNVMISPKVSSTRRNPNVRIFNRKVEKQKLNDLLSKERFSTELDKSIESVDIYIILA